MPWRDRGYGGQRRVTRAPRQFGRRLQGGCFLSRQLPCVGGKAVLVDDDVNSGCASPVHHEGGIRLPSTATPARRKPHGLAKCRRSREESGLQACYGNPCKCRGFYLARASPVHHATWGASSGSGRKRTARSARAAWLNENGDRRTRAGSERCLLAEKGVNAANQGGDLCAEVGAASFYVSASVMATGARLALVALRR
jgi:hypothetical protein